MVNKKRKKTEAETMHTVGVRFISGPRPGNIYHYKVTRRAEVHLGQELVVHNDHGISVVVVVQIDKGIRDVPGVLLKTITEKVAPL